MLSMRLLRPMHPVLAYAMANLAYMPMRAVVTLPILAILLVTELSRMTTDWSVWLLWPLAMVGGWLITFFANVAIGALSFFIDSSIKIMDVWLAAFFVFSGYLFPLELFPEWLRVAAQWLPVSLPDRPAGGVDDRAAQRGGGACRCWRASSPGPAVMIGVALSLWRGGRQALPGLRRADMTRYLRLLGLQLRTSALLAAQYRFDFFVDAIISLFWTATAVVPLFVVYGDEVAPRHSRLDLRRGAGGDRLLHPAAGRARRRHQPRAAGGDRSHPQGHARLRAAQAGRRAVPGVHLALPALARLQPGDLGHRLRRRLPRHRPRAVAASGVLTALVLFAVATLLLYSLWILIISAAFIVVKVDNLTYLFSSIFDAARWPSSVFRGAVKFFFTFVIPLTVMTTFPAAGAAGPAGAADAGLQHRGGVCLRGRGPGHLAAEHRALHLRGRVTRACRR